MPGDVSAQLATRLRSIPGFFRSAGRSIAALGARAYAEAAFVAWGEPGGLGILPERARPVTRQTEGFRDRIVAEDWTAEFVVEGDRYRLTVPVGYAFRPNVPGAFTPIAPRDRLRFASAAHDWIFIHNGRHLGRWLKKERPLRFTGGPSPYRPVERVDRMFADRAFDALMRRAPVHRLRLPFVRLAVRVAGAVAWNRQITERQKGILRRVYHRAGEEYPFGPDHKP
jgi:hypothetical protein